MLLFLGTVLGDNCYCCKCSFSSFGKSSVLFWDTNIIIIHTIIMAGKLDFLIKKIKQNVTYKLSLLPNKHLLTNDPCKNRLKIFINKLCKLFFVDFSKINYSLFCLYPFFEYEIMMIMNPLVYNWLFTALI